MTLTTHVRVVEPTAVKPIFDYARRLLGAERAAFDHRKHWALSNLVYANTIDQGYPALLWVSYGPDGPLDTDPCDDFEEGLRPGHEHPPRGSIQISFDTAPLNYYADNGASPSDLHAWLIREIGQWLSNRNLTWWWCHRGVWSSLGRCRGLAMQTAARCLAPLSRWSMVDPGRHKSRQGIAATAADLQELFGQRLVAVIAGINDAKAVGRWARGEDVPRAQAATTLQNAMHVVELLRSQEDDETIRSWFRGMNPDLDDGSPALLIRDQPEGVIQAARAFLAH